MVGIDYGRGQTNIDTKTGIRYGVISQHSMADWFFDSFEPDYGPPTCPKCGNSPVAHASDVGESQEWFDKEYGCMSCEHSFDSDEAYGDEPIGHSLDEDGVKAIDCLDSDVMVIQSPFYTYAPFCSPCVPGAGDLDSAARETNPMHTATEDFYAHGVRAYCFGHDWFDGGKAPYRVFRVEDDTEVLPE